MDWIIDNWYIMLGTLVVLIVGVAYVYGFINMDRDEQIEKVKEWLKYAVLQAEKELGGGTGMAKLSMVYDLFVARFPWLAKIITFSQFAKLVDDALVWLRNQIEYNNNIKEIVNNENK